MKSGEAIDNLKADMKEAAAEKCESLAGNDTTVNGVDVCEQGILKKYDEEAAAEKKNLTEECIQWVNQKYENMTSGPSIFDNLAEMKDAAEEWFESAKDDLSDFKEGIVNGTSELKNNVIDGTTDKLDGLKSDPGANTTRLYIVADAVQSVGAPRLAIGGSLAMLATGILAVAVAARFCSRRRGFHVVDGGEQAADGSAQHA